MRIIFMGTPDFAVATLDALVQAGHEVVLAVTQPDRARGRHGEPQKSEVRKRAEEYGIPVITPESIRKDEEAKEALRRLSPELIVVTAFGQILPEEVLNIPKHGCINVHASLLPKYRGAAPIQWAILNGDSVSGVTTMQMDEGLDTGDILLQEELRLTEKETGGSLFEKLSVLGGRLIVKTIEELEKGRLVRKKQEEALATKVGVFRKTSGLINWNRSAAEIERMVRGLSPWPSAYTYLNGKQLKLWECELFTEEAAETAPSLPLDEKRIMEAAGEDAGDFAFRGNAGRLSMEGELLTVQTGEGRLRIRELQLEGKRRMKAEEFLRGYRQD